MGEDQRAFGRQGFIESDIVGSPDQLRERLSPLLERSLPQVVTLEAEEVESDKRSPPALARKAAKSE